MPIWGVVNQKGGVGKTTTAVNLSYGLAEQGFKTLLLDCDPQGNATSGLGVDKSNLFQTMFDVFQSVVEDPNGGEEAIRQSTVQVTDKLDLVPATLDLAGAEPLLLSAVGKEMILRDALERVKDDYDWIIIDAPPSLGILTINILACSNRALVPMQCEFYALEGLSQLIKTIEIVKRRINPGLEIAKVVLTMVDSRNKLTHQVMQEVKDFFGEKVSETMIPRNVRLSEAPSFGESAMKMFPTSKGSIAYRALVEEMVGRCGAV